MGGGHHKRVAHTRAQGDFQRISFQSSGGIGPVARGFFFREKKFDGIKTLSLRTPSNLNCSPGNGRHLGGSSEANRPKLGKHWGISRTSSARPRFAAVCGFSMGAGILLVVSGCVVDESFGHCLSVARARRRRYDTRGCLFVSPVASHTSPPSRALRAPATPPRASRAVGSRFRVGRRDDVLHDMSRGARERDGGRGSVRPRGRAMPSTRGALISRRLH